MKSIIAAVFIFSTVQTDAQSPDSWPQFQRDAARTGQTDAEVVPPFRARWFWLGPDITLRNAASEPAWPDDLESREGYTFPLPDTYHITIAKGVQPVVVGGRVFIGTMEGLVCGIDVWDGSSLWTMDMEDPVITTACADDEQVVFADVYGDVAAMDALTGEIRWSFTADRSITTAPLLWNDQLFIATHGGTVYSLDWLTGAMLWSRRFPTPILGQLAASASHLFVPVENMRVYALLPSNGDIEAYNLVKGQSFRLTHPVVHSGRLWLTTCQIPAVGSEGVFDDVLAASDSLEEEEALTIDFLFGQGDFQQASPDWNHIFSLDTQGLSQDYTIPNGPVEGVGYPLSGVGITGDHRVVSWFRTRFPTFTKDSPAFGTDYPIDIAAINPLTGKRQVIDNGVFSNMFPGPETDNLYTFTSGGNYLWLRQEFRGTQCIHIHTSQHTHVMASVRHRDGGDFFADVCVHNKIENRPPYRQRPLEGKAGAVIIEGMVLLPEVGGILALESK